MKGDYEAAKTHCPQGHEYSTANARLYRGSRHCIQCAKDREAVRGELAKAKRREGGKVIVLNKDKTHCIRGHEFTEANTRSIKTGGRWCRACDLMNQTERNNANPALMMWRKAKQRAKAKNVAFTITPEDIHIPPCCPVLGVPLERKVGRGPGPYSPSLDRIIASKGYIPGNIVVISLRANRIKNDATLEELERVTAWLRATLREKEPTQ